VPLAILAGSPPAAPALASDRQSGPRSHGEYCHAAFDRRVAPISSRLTPRPNPHSVCCTAAAHRPRFRALALLGRRPPQRVDGLVIPASEKPAHKRKWASDVVTPRRPHHCAVRRNSPLSPNQRFSYSRFQAAVCSMLEPCARRADPVCGFAELAANFFAQSFMLPCCAIAFNDFSGTNIGMGFRSVTDTDCYIVMERANRCRAHRRQRISNDRSEIVGPAINGHKRSLSASSKSFLKADYKNHAAL
jgi:hypothetical protein